jgi:hypothetical protein
MTPSSRDIEQISRSQSRQQILLIILCIAVAACAAATWRAGSAMRDANELQKQILAEPADAATKQPNKRQASARAGKKASVQSQAPSLPRERRGSNDRQVTDENSAPTEVTSTRTAMVRVGRQ